MNHPFSEKYTIEIELLIDLFGPDVMDEYLPRLQEIYEYTEGIWHTYVRRIGNTPIRYLLVAEAPPWSESGKPEYVLDPTSKPRSLLSALRNAFIGTKPVLPSECLKVLSSKGFLVLDSIPFSMDYSQKRSSKKYDRLIESTVKSYLQAKINVTSLKWSSDVRIAFAVARNARSIMKSVRHLEFNGRKYFLSEDMIAVNRAGYPDANKLSDIFGLRSGICEL